MTPGQAAYEKFTDLLATGYTPAAYPDLTALARTQWEEIAQAAIKEYEHENSCSICRAEKVSGDSDAAEGSTPEANEIGHHRAQAARERGIPVPDGTIIQ